jgi:hypothetical protein
MNAQTDETEFERHALAVAIWENEGGSPQQDSMHYQYGRRIERDGSWSIYHVFTGVPAEIQGRRLTGMNRANATEGMLSLNRHNERGQPKRRPTADSPADYGINGGRP